MKNTKLINARKSKGYTQKDVADFLQIRVSTVSNWETGYSRPALDMAIEVARYLDADVANLFGTNVQEVHT
ncbi:helix-turn-helix transcriptional regulator [Listeria booriae]|uniref:helix-turn-helix transcriptional regulator n=1 Tax=Listeria booriae TaxID=1552123 RepID=UPI0016280C65|nr:helix-turn-helix transcriptional regulator [Listeria booriae]MBC1887985.1 helix-turn-helix transcriptional regulator [Listeria booriae]